jgi:hypothetical protein
MEAITPLNLKIIKFSSEPIYKSETFLQMERIPSISADKVEKKAHKLIAIINTL